MFKKKNFKKQNVLEDFDHNTSYKEENELPEGDAVVKKKVKTKADNTFTTKAQTEEYEKKAQMYQDEIQYKAKSVLLTKDNGNAFAENLIDPDADNDARAMKIRQMERSKEQRDKEDSKYYKGSSNYTVYATKSENDIHNSKFTGTMGPIRASKNVRQTCNIDYNPMLCKDYHDTGFCSFGDTCIFIHDRGDYKSGWEMERDWEQEQAAKARRLQIKSRALEEGENAEDDENGDQEDDDGIPRACQLCDDEFKSPVMTACRHYFCESCIMNHFRDSKQCPVCDSRLNGIFNTARDVIVKMKKLQSKKGGGNASKKIKIGEADPEKVEQENKKEEEEEQKKQETKKKDDDEEEVDLEKIAEEFKDTMKQQKGKFKAGESDWAY